jgi:hypothetical protein
MTSIHLEDVNNTFFSFGYIKEPADPGIIEKVRSLGKNVKIRPLDGFGYYYYTQPKYVDIAENDEMVWIKSGHTHDSQTLLSTADLIQSHALTSEGVNADLVCGNATIFGFMKHDPVCFIYRSLVSATPVYVHEDNETLICSDNMRVMVGLLDNPEFNEGILPMHFLYREVYGDKTYIRNVSQLTGGEQLSYQNGRIEKNLLRDFRHYVCPDQYKSFNPDTVEWFFQKFAGVIGLHLAGNGHGSATMLSGGIDSSLIQAAINDQPNEDFPSYSYIIDSPGFAYEVKHAQDASQALDTQHTFVRLSPERYAEGFVESTKILGEPMADDARSCFLLMADHISINNPGIDTLFHGGAAGSLHGGDGSRQLYQGDKYRHWPVSFLELMGSIAAPISHSKSYGAKNAAQVLGGIKDENSVENFLNASGMYTDLGLVERCFSPISVMEAFADRRDLEVRLLNSDVLVEKGGTLDLITSSQRMKILERAMGLFHGINYIHPYADEEIVAASFSFDPMQRYVHNHRPKPILTAALETHVPDFNTRIPKGWSGYGMQELFISMREGELSEMVRAIDRPGFLSQKDFADKIENPDWFTWSMFTLDLFKKHVLNGRYQICSQGELEIEAA